MDLQTTLDGRVGQLTSNFANSDATSIVQSINVPVLITQGLNDIVILPATTNFWQTNLIHSPDVKLLNFPNIGHMIQIEDSGKFNKALSDFAKKISQ